MISLVLQEFDVLDIPFAELLLTVGGFFQLFSSDVVGPGFLSTLKEASVLG